MFFKDKLRKKIKFNIYLAKKISHKKNINQNQFDLINSLSQRLNILLKQKKTSLVLLKNANKRLEFLLKNYNEKYISNFFSEIIELSLVTLIMIIGIKLFFFQTFQIPTNSMYPTYKGLNSRIYLEEEKSPNLIKKIIKRTIFGENFYEIISPYEGNISIPILNRNDSSNFIQYRLESKKFFFGLLNSNKKKYIIYINKKPLSFKIPNNVSLDDIILKKFFPNEETLYQALIKEYKDGNISHINNQLVVNIKNKKIKSQESILKFDIISGDKLLVDLLIYNFKKPNIGDPIVFQTINIPNIIGNEKYFIKRIVGLEKDILYIKNSILYRNGTPINGSLIFNYNNYQTKKEYKGYKAYGRLDKNAKEIIPKDSLYLMGDNSTISSDSRYWGFVPKKEIIGKARFIFYPFSERWGISQ